MDTHIDEGMVPDWIIEIVIKLSNQEKTSLEQAVRMLIYRGALFYSENLQGERQ